MRKTKYPYKAAELLWKGLPTYQPGNDKRTPLVLVLVVAHNGELEIKSW